MSIQLISSRPGRWEGEGGHNPRPVLTYRYMVGGPGTDKPPWLGLEVDARDDGQLAADVAAAWHSHTGPHRLETATYTTSYFDKRHGLVVTRRGQGTGLQTATHTIQVYKAGSGASRISLLSLSQDLPGVWAMCTRVWLRLRHAHGAIDRRWTEIANIDWTTAPTDHAAPAAEVYP